MKVWLNAYIHSINFVCVCEIWAGRRLGILTNYLIRKWCRFLFYQQIINTGVLHCDVHEEHTNRSSFRGINLWSAACRCFVFKMVYNNWQELNHHVPFFSRIRWHLLTDSITSYQIKMLVCINEWAPMTSHWVEQIIHIRQHVEEITDVRLSTTQ